MMRSMFAGVSGLRNHQLKMDVIGNNIANVNTVGFKPSRVTFQEMFSQIIRGASAPSDDLGGTNPMQVGLGMSLASIDVMHVQGNLQMTGRATDMAVQGDGFFVVRDEGRRLFTRAGNFCLDGLGYLTSPNGLRVQGWVAQNGVFPVKDESNLSDIRILKGESIPAEATDEMTWGYNLDAGMAVGDSKSIPIKVFDSLGNVHTVTFTFTKNVAPPDNEWTWNAEESGVPCGNGTLTFATDGTLSAGGTGTIAFNPPGADPINIALDFSRVTQYAGDTTVSAIEVDGYTTGSLTSYSIDARGIITGSYSNGISRELAQVALGLFSNPGGLLKVGDNLFEESNNSGAVRVGEPSTGGRGGVAPGNLEMSSVDLAREFTEMITTQRGFQVNSRVITTSDEMLQELVNLKR